MVLPLFRIQEDYAAIALCCCWYCCSNCTGLTYPNAECRRFRLYQTSIAIRNFKRRIALARQGLYPDAPRKPCVMGYEVAGLVEEVGEGVDQELIGGPVVAMTRFGGQSEKVVVKEKQLFEKPDSLTFEQAAAIPVNYLTAYALLVAMGGLRKGEAVLIHNAGGGVGLAALDIAKHIGAVTYGTASPSKHEFLRKRGFDHPIDYRTQDWLPVLKKLTGGRGVELVIDPIGGSHWKKSYEPFDIPAGWECLASRKHLPMA